MNKIAVSFRHLKGGVRRRAGFTFGIVPSLIEVTDEQLKEIQEDSFLTLHPIDSYNFRVAEDIYNKKEKEVKTEKQKQESKKNVVKKNVTKK